MTSNSTREIAGGKVHVMNWGVESGPKAPPQSSPHGAIFPRVILHRGMAVGGGRGAVEGGVELIRGFVTRHCYRHLG